MKPEISERLQWFLDRIGTRVYRERFTADGIWYCECNACKNGIFINNEEQARTLYNIEMTESYDVIYFEKPKP